MQSSIEHTLHTTALAEIAIYRDVSAAVMCHLGRILGWSRAELAALTVGIQAVYAYERLGGWRRMVSLHTPAQVSSRARARIRTQRVRQGTGQARRAARRARG